MKSQEEKQLQGTNRQDRRAPGRGDLTKMPRQPAIELGKEGRKFWKQMGQLLIKEQALCETDLHALAIFAWWFEQALEARLLLKRKGFIQLYKSGARNISPEFSVVERIDSKLQTYFRYFGMTPYHRERLVTSVKQSGNASDDYASAWADLLSVNSN